METETHRPICLFGHEIGGLLSSMIVLTLSRACLLKSLNKHQHVSQPIHFANGGTGVWSNIQEEASQAVDTTVHV